MVGVLAEDEELIEDGEDDRAFGSAQKEWRLD